MDTQTRHALKKGQLCPSHCKQRQLAEWSPFRRSALGHYLSSGRGSRAGCWRADLSGVCSRSAADGYRAWKRRWISYVAPLTRAGCSARERESTQAPPSARKPPIKHVYRSGASSTAGCLKGTKAHYFAGNYGSGTGSDRLCGDGIEDLQPEAWDRNVANLAKLALAGIYHQTARDNQAIEIYTRRFGRQAEQRQFLPAWRSLILPIFMPQTGKQDLARALWAKVKDADKDGAAGSIAAQKLAASAVKAAATR